MSRNLLTPLIILAVVLGLASMSVFTVNQAELAIKFKFGRIIEADYAPGLHFMFPIVNNVNKFDKRILTIDRKPERFLTGETKFVNVDFFVKWRITDVAQYYVATSGIESVAADRLLAIVTNAMKEEFAKRTIQQVVKAQRAELMQSMLTAAREVSSQYGVELIDVRVKRIDLPDEVSGSVFERMRQERVRIASKLRAEGMQTSEEIRAKAERERVVILAEANREAQEIRGVGDARSAEIYAEAYTQNPEFYSFYRSMLAYRTALGQGRDILVLQPDDSEFFKYLNRAGR